MIAVLLTLLIIPVFMLIRNNWVYKTRIRWIDEGRNDYDRAVNYGAMMRRIWCWDANIRSWLK